MYPNVHQPGNTLHPIAPQQPTYEGMPNVMNQPSPMVIQPVIMNQPMAVRSVVFSEYPVQMTCPFCQQLITTRIELVNGSVTWIVTILTCLVIFPFNFLFLCSDCLKDKHHYCPRCNHLLGKKTMA